ncbi:glycosyltransferase [bacterium SCSIO 12741]|nr:glycosyltransferase [bacterium SCSIO 12741]
MTKEFDLDNSFWDIVVELFYNILYIYSVSIMVTYLVLAIISFISVRKYLHKNSFVDYKDILNTDFAPSVSILAPAYNEAATIIDNIRSLLSIHYSNYEVIIVNDGSKDNTLELCIEEYDLVPVDYAIDDKLKTKDVRAVYKSRNKVFNQLVVVDKVNGGKSDALNVAINIASYDYVTCIDVDCVLEQDALLKLMKPFMDENKKEVIATGGVIRIANSCVIENGQLVEVKVPKNFVARSQTLEYIRAFLLGRMAWSLLDGLILISGALGVFKKDIVVEVGGYDNKTVGEDMELIVRMRRHMIDTKRQYTVALIPDPLCWTESPETWSQLGRQRNRWTRGTIETLWQHRGMLFNPKYKLIGMLSYPFWLFFEWAAPLLEAMGLMLFALLAVAGLVNWSFFGLMILLIFGFTITFSVLSLLIEEITYHNYKRKRDILRLLQVGMLEPLFYHLHLVYSAVMGNLDFLLGTSSWGEMARKGFDGDGKPKRIQVVKSIITEGPKKAAVRASYATWTAVSIALMAIFLYYIVDLDKLLTKDELAMNPKLRNVFVKKETATETIMRKEKEILAKSIQRSLAKSMAQTQREQDADSDNSNRETTSSSSTPPDQVASTKPEKQETTPAKKEEDNTASATPPAPNSREARRAIQAKYRAKKKPTDNRVFYLVAGSYKEEKNAFKRRNELRRKGFKGAQVYTNGEVYRVTFVKYYDEEEALENLKTLRAEENEGAWMLRGVRG